MTRGMTGRPASGVQKRYELITQVLRHNIQSGRLPPGCVILEGPVAELLQSSRAPVQAALRLLEAEHLVHRFAGRGYLVGREGSGVAPLRADIRTLDLQVSDEIDEALQSRGAWQHVYDRVEEEVASSLIFGEFRIIESELASYLGVSRTVARDVLSRLQERGLIRKNQSSHWIAGPLTAQAVREKFELRAILEPVALQMAFAHIDYPAVERIRARLAADEPVGWETLEAGLFEHCIARVPNVQLVEAIRSNQLLLIAANSALTRLGLPPDSIALAEYRALFDLIARHRPESAADYLRGNLQIMARKSLARLKIVAVISGTSVLPPYLTPK